MMPKRAQQCSDMYVQHQAQVHAAGVPVSADIVLRSSFLSIATWLNSKQASSAADASEGPQDMDTDSAQPLTASTSGEAGSEQSAAQDEIIKKVMQELVFHSRAEVSCCLSFTS